MKEHSAGTRSRSAIWPRPAVDLRKLVGGNRPIPGRRPRRLIAVKQSLTGAPRPQLHLIPFRAVLAPNAKIRAMVVPRSLSRGQALQAAWAPSRPRRSSGPALRGPAVSGVFSTGAKRQDGQVGPANERSAVLVRPGSSALGGPVDDKNRNQSLG
jgi:hypothetical protein